jgi:outer membrane receptor protein involved in Fe transport
MKTAPTSALAVAVLFTALTSAAFAQATPASRANPARLTDPAMLAKYDANRNGRLDPEEVAAMDAAERSGGRPGDETVQLNVFEVSADRDDSYGALNSNSITRFNTELAKLPISADIYNEAFMRDINATSVEQMISEYTAGAGFASNDAASSAEEGMAPGDRQANASIRLRGLTAPAMLRDAFMTLQTYSNTGSTATGVTNSFDLERTEVIMGPQSLLYGGGGAGGVVNLVSKQARFNKRFGGNLRFRNDNFGSKIFTLDVGWGNRNLAVRGAFINQLQKTRRINIGNDLDGQYLQIAWRPFDNTVVRLSGTQTWNFRTYATNLTVNATNVATDARHNQKLRYLLATNQIEAPASGASRGPIAGGNLHWGNVDSWFGDSRAERTIDTLGMLTVETTWTRGVTTQLAIGYKDFYNQLFTESTSALLAPGAANNATGVWAVGATGTGLQRNIQPGTAFPARASVAFDHGILRTRARAQTIIGADYLRMRNAFINYNYFAADDNFNPIVVGGPTSPNNGRTNMPAVVWPMTTLSEHPIPGWSPGLQNFTMGGRNYVLMQSNPANVFPRTPDNPHGVTPGGSNYNIDNARNKGVFGVTDIAWMGGRLHTLAGFRYAHNYVIRESQGTAITATNPESGAIKLNDDKFLSYNVGANYALRDWLRPYFSISDSYSQPAGANNDPLGETLQAAHSVGGELGVKVQNASGTVSGSLALYHANAKNEAMTVTSTLSGYINPSGLNGRFGGAPSVWMNVDRKTSGLQATFTANPTRNLRVRASAGTYTAEIANTKSYPQVYNDQFHANAQGQVTYRNGQVVFVPPAFSATNLTVPQGTAGAIPLTIAMLSTSSSPYFTSPQVVTGQITQNSNGGRVLLANNALTQQNGPIITGATGLPISQIQINPGFTPPAEIPVTQAGERSTNGASISANFTAMYSFSEGMLRGLRMGGSGFFAWDNRGYYFYPNGVNLSGEREVFKFPTRIQFDAIVGYDFRLRGRYSLGVQLNVRNVTNHYKVMILPHPVNGWAGPNGATFYGEPRSWELSTTLGF